MRCAGPILLLCLAVLARGQTPGGLRLAPNLVNNIDRPLRYRPDGADFVIENGAEYFNRPLYGGNTAFRVDGGDKPEFVLYLPGRGGNLRLGVRAATGAARWLHQAAKITTRYRPGTLRYEIRDPLLGAEGVLRLTAVAYHQIEGLGVRVEAEKIASGLELIWAYGGVNGQRGARDGDIGTERVPISVWFQLQPEFARDNRFESGAGNFVLRAKPATIVGVVPEGAVQRVADAAQWSDPGALLTTEHGTTPATPVIVGRVALVGARPYLISLQLAAGTDAAGSTGAEVPRVFEGALRHFDALRTRVTVDTPDPFLNAAVGALNVAADAVWDEPQQAIMHGAIAWRAKLLGWRGPYAFDALGWHDRAQKHFLYWAGRQNVQPVPEQIPPADENANLARSETALHSNGDLSKSHYDMNLVYVDALFRHLRWTGDLELAKKLWPVIERHLAWERRLFRREFGPEQLPLYEACAAIWASDDLQYHGGGVMHASAYNFFHNQQAARLARLLGADPTLYQREAQLLERGMREHLWLPERGHFAEFKDLLGLQRVHPSAALWTFYHTMDSEVPTPQEAWSMMRQVDAEIPHLPVRGPGVPEGFYTLGTSNWLPYTWSINNVVMAEAVHAALGYWQAGRPEDAWKITKGSLLAAMFMGISPGNVGSMSYLDVHRRESQRDFADGSGVLSRALIEGLFGVRPDALAGELQVVPGWPADWNRAGLKHPNVSVEFKRELFTDSYVVTQHGAKSLALRLRLKARFDAIDFITVGGAPVPWRPVENAVGAPRLDVVAPASPSGTHRIVVRWRPVNGPALNAVTDGKDPFVVMAQGQMKWLQAANKPWFRALVVNPLMPAMPLDPRGAELEPLDLAGHFNDRVTQIFKNEYRAPRSPFASLALPKQGIGGWAGGVNASALIDDSGLRALAERAGGRFVLPSGAWFETPGEATAKNVVFTSQWDNYPREVTLPLRGNARGLFLLMAGSTNHMQSRFDNGEVVATYADGTTARLALENPTTWWPIERDYFFDDFQFRIDATTRLPTRVDLKTGEVRVLELATFKGRGGRVPGGAATVLELALDPEKELKSMTVRALANEVVIGLMAATVMR